MEEYSAPPCFKCKIFNISQERSEVTRLGNFLSHPANFRNYRRALHTGLSGIIVMDRRRVEQSLKDLSIRRDHSFRILGIFQREIWEIWNREGGKNSLKFLLRLQFLQLFILFIGTKHMKFWTFSRISCLNNSQLTLCIPNIFSSGEATTLDD